MKNGIHVRYNDTFEKMCKFAANAGFKYVSVNFTQVLDRTEKEWEQITDNIGNVLAANNLRCEQTHPFYYPLNMSSEIVEEKSEFAIKQAIIASGKIGAKWCALHPRSSVSTGFSGKQALEDNRKYLYDYLEYAVKYDTGLAAENLPIFPQSCPSYPFYASDYYDLCELVDSINDEHVGICWDTGHAHLMAYDQAEAIKFLGKRIKCTHIHNNKRQQDSHFPPDNGDIDWNSVMGAFAAVGYEGPLTLETEIEYQADELLQNFMMHNYGCIEYLDKLLK